MATVPIVPCLWFDSEAEEAATFYAGVFPDSRITAVSRYPTSGDNPGGKPPGSVLTVEFDLAGNRFTALNGGPQFRFSEAVSLQVLCEDQAEVDHYWERLCDGGEEGPCGWLKDRFGLSWQVVPKEAIPMMTSDDAAARDRAFQAMLTMGKLDVAALRAAYAG